VAGTSQSEWCRCARRPVLHRGLTGITATALICCCCRVVILMPPSADSKSPPHRVVLLVRDGWGYSANKKGNAIAEAKTPHTDDVMKRYAHCLLSASGETVGLPKGDMVSQRRARSS
jgi:hypothetical protein